MVRDGTRWVYCMCHVSRIVRRNYKVQRTSCLLSWLTDMLLQSKSGKYIQEANGVGVAWIFNMYVEISADNERTSQQNDGLEQRGEIDEELRQRPGGAGRAVHSDDDEQRPANRDPNCETLKRRRSW